MTIIQKTDLRERILAVLKQNGKPLRIPQIEVELKHGDYWDADTFDIRDAVAKLIDQGELEEKHPGRLVQLATVTNEVGVGG